MRVVRATVLSPPRCCGERLLSASFFSNLSIIGFMVLLHIHSHRKNARASREIYILVSAQAQQTSMGRDVPSSTNFYGTRCSKLVEPANYQRNLLFIRPSCLDTDSITREMRTTSLFSIDKLTSPGQQYCTSSEVTSVTVCSLL